MHINIHSYTEMFLTICNNRLKNYSIIKVSSIFFWLIRTSHINYFFFKRKEASMLIHQLEGGVCALHLNFCIVLNIRKPNSRLVIRDIQCTRFDLITCHLFWNFSCHSNWQKTFSASMTTFCISNLI